MKTHEPLIRCTIPLPRSYYALEERLRARRNKRLCDIPQCNETCGLIHEPTISVAQHRRDCMILGTLVLQRLLARGDDAYVGGELSEAYVAKLSE